jgi:pantothenate kinase
LPSARVIITEGNYLFATDHNWHGVFPLLDQAYYIEISDELRLARLIARHHAYGKSMEDAESWARGSDEANARFIERTRGRAEKVIHIS